MLFDDAEAGRQAQPCAFALLFGGEEWLEQVTLHLGVHADPGIAHRQQHIRPLVDAQMILRIGRVQEDIARLDGQFAALRHGIAGIDRQIHQHLLDLPRVRQDVAQIGSGLRNQVQVFADHPTQHVVEIQDQRVEIEHARLDRLFTCKGEQLVSESRGALGSVEDFVQIAGDLMILRWQRVAGQLGIPADRREQVVEVVGNAPRQPADTLHLLRLEQLCFELFAIGDIVRDPDHPDDRAVLVVVRPFGGEIGPHFTCGGDNFFTGVGHPSAIICSSVCRI